MKEVNIIFYVLNNFSLFYFIHPITKICTFCSKKKKRIRKKTLNIIIGGLKKWNIVQPKEIEDFGWCVIYSLFQLSTVSLISLFIYYYYYFYVGVVGDLCSLENWYYRILILMTGFLQNATLAVDALSIWCVVLFWSSLPMFY